MRVVMLYHPASELAGRSEDYARDYHSQHPSKQAFELISLETVEGAEMAKLYDVVRYPAILAIANDGSLQKLWQDQPWPLMNEVAAYAAEDSK